MKSYEINCIIANISEEEARATAEKIVKIIEEKGGKVEKTETPKRVPFGYSIKGHAKGFLATIFYKAPSEKIKEIEENVKKEEGVLRIMIVLNEVKKFTPREPEEPLAVTERKKVELKEIDEKIEEILSE